MKIADYILILKNRANIAVQNRRALDKDDLSPETNELWNEYTTEIKTLRKVIDELENLRKINPIN